MREGKAFFNPCYFKAHIYLCGNNSRQIEVFSPALSAFISDIDILIPTLSSDSCSVYVDEGLLVVHSRSFIVKYESVEGQVRAHTETLLQPTVVGKYTNSQPVVGLGDLVFIFQENRCFSFHKHTGTEVRSY
jgi:hypothetical protein